jgi:hypothetical protein
MDASLTKSRLSVATIGDPEIPPNRTHLGRAKTEAVDLIRTSCATTHSITSEVPRLAAVPQGPVGRSCAAYCPAKSSPKAFDAPVTGTHEIVFAVMLFTGLISFEQKRCSMATDRPKITLLRLSRVLASPQQYPHQLPV